MKSRNLWVLALAWALLPGAAGATWSIVLTDSATGEIAIGSATCVTNIDLKRLASVVVVNKGAGAAQSVVDPTGQNRQLIFQELMNETAPAQILQLLEAQDPQHETRQYGIVDTMERAVGFTGSSAGGFAGHLTGQMGTMRYAIQGNLLTGAPVLTAAEAAIRSPDGDLPTKLMGGMLAARDMGGDGRCSCSPSNPEACGSPPPSFEKSAHVGYMVVSRLGDEDGTCNAAVGCANGSYYLDLNVAFQGAGAEDPVLQLQQQFAQWQQSQEGKPDHQRSDMILLDQSLPADGASRTRSFVVTRDLFGRAVKTPATVRVAIDPSSSATATIDPVIPKGEGIYLVRIQAGASPGEVVLDVTIDDGLVTVPLSPRPVLELRATQ